MNILKSDDSDIRESYFRTTLGGNGDYYLTIFERKEDGLLNNNTIRISTSGGNAPSEIKIAIGELHRLMDKHGLNGYPEF